MAIITFKAKIIDVLNIDNTPAFSYIRVPVLDRKHCDMNAFRVHPKYGAYANSDLFKGMLAGIRKSTFGGEMLRMDSIPDGVSVDTSGFLAKVTFSV